MTRSASDWYRALVACQVKPAVAAGASSQIEAKATGLKHYFTGRSCKRGHVESRLASTGQCMACMRARAMQNYRDNPLIGREKAKLYREANPEKVRAATDAWHEANREYRGGYKKAKYQQNAEANRAAGRARYEGNKDFLRESSRVRMATLKLAGRLSVDNAKRSAHTAKRRASSLQATPPWFGEFDDLVAREAQDLRLRRNKMTSCRWEVDHAYPLRSKWVSGLHCAANLQVIPKPLNNSKSNRDVYTEPLSWIQAL